MSNDPHRPTPVSGPKTISGAQEEPPDGVAPQPAAGMQEEGSTGIRAKPAGQGPRCPSCGRPRVQQFRPFCSERCRDLDLARWFGEAYAVPAVEPGYDEDDEPAQP